MKAKKRLLSLLLCGTMLFSLCPQSVLAETSAQDSGAVISAGGLCKHHSEHDEDCGYTEGTAGFPCTYEHIFPAARWPGYWKMWKAPGKRQKKESCCLEL